MAAPAIVQTSRIVNTSTACPFTLALTGVTAGNTLVLMWFDLTNAGRHINYTDTQNNRWVSLVTFASGGSQGMCVGIAKGVAGGNTTVTVSSGAAAAAIDAVLYELGPCTLDVWDWNIGASGTSHFCGQSAGISIAADSLVLAHGRTANLGVTTVSAGSGYTAEVTNVSGYIQQRQAFTTLTTGERAAFSSTGTARVFTGAMYSFRNITSGGGSSSMKFYQNMGGGFS